MKWFTCSLTYLSIIFLDKNNCINLFPRFRRGYLKVSNFNKDTLSEFPKKAINIHIFTIFGIFPSLEFFFFQKHDKDCKTSPNDQIKKIIVYLMVWFRDEIKKKPWQI